MASFKKNKKNLNFHYVMIQESKLLSTNWMLINSNHLTRTCKKSQTNVFFLNSLMVLSVVVKRKENTLHKNYYMHTRND